MNAPAELPHRLVDVGAVRLSVAEAGPDDGPLVVLLHGFPELGYSWRHQVPALAQAGYRLLIPDLRGYGDSDAPQPVEAYAITELAADVIGLIDSAGRDDAVIVGHDWGADLAWKTAWLHPERIRAVAGLSVPFVPRAPARPTELMRAKFGEDFYIVWFQEPAVADIALEQDVRRTLATPRVWDAAWAADRDEHPRTPAFMTDAELDVYVRVFARTGFRGGLNWYRNIDRNWADTERIGDRRIEQPAFFLTGERDPVRTFMPADGMRDWVTDLRGELVVPRAGHWVNQQAPDEVNAALLEFLNGVA